MKQESHPFKGVECQVKHLVSEKEKRDQKASKLAEEQKILRLEQQVEEEGQKATAHMLSQWMGISDLLAGALTKTRKRFESQHNPLVLYGELSELDGYFNTILALAEAVFPRTSGKMQITYALPDEDRECLQVVHVTPERSQAPSGQKIPLKGKNVPKWGAAQAFLTGQPFYAEDVSIHQVSGRPYQSVLSVPVLDSSGTVLAVVNINSDQISPFGPEDSAGATTFLFLIDPSIKALSIGAYLRKVVP